MAAGYAVAIRACQVRRLEAQKALGSAAVMRAVLGDRHLGTAKRRAEGHPAGHFRIFELLGAGDLAGEEVPEEVRLVHHIVAAPVHQGHQSHQYRPDQMDQMNQRAQMDQMD